MAAHLVRAEVVAVALPLTAVILHLMRTVIVAQDARLQGLKLNEMCIRDRAVSVWTGNTDNSPMVDISGLTGAAPLWGSYMEQVYSNACLLYTSVNPLSLLYSQGVAFIRI